MKKEDVSNLIHQVTPCIFGVIIGLLIAVVVCLSSGAFVDTKEIANSPQFNLSTGEIVITNTTYTGISDAGNSVINLLSGFLIGLGIICILFLLIDLFYLTRKDGV